MRDLVEARRYLRGEVRAYRAFEDGTPEVIGGCPVGWRRATDFTHNDFLFEWGAIFANLLMRKGVNYGIGGMYLEFANVASPGDIVTPPDFTRYPENGVDYYNGLSTSPDLDYLRVPLVATTLQVSDTTKFPKGNQPTFFAQTRGLVGVHGKPFSDANNSVVFGGALVAFVDDADPTQDIVLSRFYLASDKQQPKLATSQIGFEWRLTLT